MIVLFAWVDVFGESIESLPLFIVVLLFTPLMSILAIAVFIAFTFAC